MLTPHGIVFLSLLLFFQVVLVFWAWRVGCGLGGLLLVAFVPLLGVPYLLFRHRHRMLDNHIAGALVYLVLLPCAFFFLLWYPKIMEEDIPWALIHTMQFFGFLGLANLVLAPPAD